MRATTAMTMIKYRTAKCIRKKSEFIATEQENHLNGLLPPVFVCYFVRARVLLFFREPSGQIKCVSIQQQYTATQQSSHSKRTQMPHAQLAFHSLFRLSSLS